MPRSTLFVAVTLLLLGHNIIYCVPIDTTDETTDPSPPASGPHSTCHHDTKLKVNNANEVLGDIPIVPDHQVEITNRRNVPLKNCKELLDYDSFNKSGLYVVQPGAGGEFVVYCDMTLLGGGWTVIQRRVNSKTSFHRNYAGYTNGFGDLAENFWLGLDKISRLTSNSDGPMEIYFGLEAFFGVSASSNYRTFSVGNKETGYTLSISGYNRSSSAGDSMSFHNNQKFSAFDKDEDKHSRDHCAKKFRSGWWYKNCHVANLNGVYYDGGALSNRYLPDGVSWGTWLGSKYSLKTTVIAIRQRTD